MNCPTTTMDSFAPQPHRMTQLLATFRRQEATDCGNASAGMEPTYQTEKFVRKWRNVENACLDRGFGPAASPPSRVRRHGKEGLKQVIG